jgi:hypothetical protein
LHNPVIDREGLYEASLLELQTQEDSFSAHLDEPERQVTRSNKRSNLRARRVRDAFTVYVNSDAGRLRENSADECVTDSDEIMCDGHLLCVINDNES